jgi:hypothetical protein
MDKFHIFIWTIVVLFLAGIIYSFYNSKYLIQQNPFLDKKLLSRGLDNPPIWLYYDQSEVNSRFWDDFGARSSRALNTPFLNLCYESIVSKNSDKYRIEVIDGLSGVANLLGGWDNLPPGLHNKISPVNEAEMNWISTAILAKHGGLWLSPYTICIRPFGELSKDKIVFFGTDINETFAGSSGTKVPGFHCIWSPKPNMPLFAEWEMLTRKRISPKTGGEQIRNDINWDWDLLSKKYGHSIDVFASAEGSRKKNGRRIQLEDLLSTGHEGQIPIDINENVIYFPMFWNELKKRQMFGWFLRMSEEQIMNSDITVKYLLNA